jgi:hypothetical protein
MVIASTVVVSHDPLSSTPSTSFMKTQDNKENDLSRERRYPNGILL